jgi:hypothetical protein
MGNNTVGSLLRFGGRNTRSRQLIVPLGIMFLVGICGIQDVSGDDSIEERAEAIGMLSAFLHNLDSLTRHDVSVRYEQSAIRPDGVFEDLVRYDRMIIDRQQQCFFFVSSVDRTATGGPSKDWMTAQDDEFRELSQDGFDADTERKQLSVSAFLYCDGLGWARQLPRARQRLAEASFESALAAIKAPALRNIAFDKYPSSSGVRGTEHHGVELLVMPAQSVVFQPKATGDYFLSVGSDLGTRGRYTQTWNVNGVSLTPSRLRTYWGSSDPNHPDPPYPVLNESYTWKDASGVYVPVRIVGEQLLPIQRRSGEQVRYPRHHQVDFQWHSIHQAIDRSRFETGLLDDTRYLLSLVDSQSFSANKADGN